MYIVPFIREQLRFWPGVGMHLVPKIGLGKPCVCMLVCLSNTHVSKQALSYRHSRLYMKDNFLFLSCLVEEGVASRLKSCETVH